MLFVYINLNKVPITTKYIFTYLMDFQHFFFSISDYNYDINQVSIET